MTAQNRSTGALWNVVALTVAASTVRESGASMVPNVPNVGTAFDRQSVLYAVEVSQ
jgi:hypothetical protein